MKTEEEKAKFNEFVARLWKANHTDEITKILLDFEKAHQEDSNKVDVAELKKKWDERSNYLKTGKNVDTDGIWRFFLPLIQQPGEAVEFQKFLFENGYYETNAKGLHVQTSQYGSISEPVKKTTEQLYTEFKNRK